MPETQIATVGLNNTAETISTAAVVKTLLDVVQKGEELYRRLPDDFKEELDLKTGDLDDGPFNGLAEIAFAVSRLSTTSRYLLIENLTKLYDLLEERASVALTDKEYKICEGIFALLQRVGDASQRNLVAGLDCLKTQEETYLIIKIDGKNSDVKRLLQCPPGLEWLFKEPAR